MKQELLTKSEERELIQRSQEGDKQALTTLVRRNEGLVHKQVHRFPLKNAQVGYSDLFQQGMLGFIHGVEMFDLTRDIRLSTYVYRWIYAYMRRYFQNQGRVVRIPAHLADKKFQLDQRVQSLTQESGHSLSKEELDELVPGYNELSATFVHTVSLNNTLDGDNELIDFQADDKNTDTTLEVDLYLDILRARVSERDYNILVSYYGVQGVEQQTMNQLSQEYDISRARAHQIIMKCVKVMKECATV